MTRWIAIPMACVAAAALTLNVEAASNGTGKTNSPKTTKTTTKGPSTTKGSSPTTKGPSAKSTSVKTNNGGSAKTTSTTTTAKGNGSSKKTASSTAASTSTSTSTSTTSTTTTDWKPTNAVAEKLMTKPNQLAKLKAVIGDSVDINDATAGFKNFGQLNAAVNVSQNLGIDFADLKAAMTGITLEGEKTNQPTKSLGQAIQQYRPEVDADAEAAAATTQATKEGGQ